MKQQPFNIILLGDPASGKGTQAERLVKRYGLYNFDMGGEVRKPAIRKRFDFANTTAVGKLTPTHVVRHILKNVISTTPAREGILFNGHPKMIGEAKLVAKWLKQYKRTNPLVMYLAISDKETLHRAHNRRIYVDGKLIKREDDNDRALKNRKAYYREQVAQVVKFFKKHYVFKTVSGMGNEAQAWKRINATVEKYLKDEARRAARVK